MYKRPASAIEEPDSKRNKTKCNDDRLLIRSSPISLKEMAAIKICLALWYHQNIRQLKRRDEDTEDEDVFDDEESYYDDYENDYDEYLERRRERGSTEVGSLSTLGGDVESSLSELSLPTAAEKIIVKYVIPIREEMEVWKRYQRKRIFFHLGDKFIYNYLDEIVWKSDGTVHYELTARSMLSSPRLSDVEKYRLMCTYCLEDVIEAARPDLFSNRYIERWSFDEHPLICYWNCKKRGELDLIFIADVGSVERRMATSVDNEHAFLYFFNRLTDDEKIDAARMMIQRYKGQYQNILINNMNDVQQHHIFMDMGADVIINYGLSIITKNYIVNSNPVESVLRIWIYVRNVICEIEFAQLFCTILSKMRTVGLLGTKDLTFFVAFELLANIWTNAPDKLKPFALEYENMRIVGLLSELTHTSRGNNFQLLTVILSDASADYKANVIQSDLCRSLCEWMIQHSRPTLLDQFIKVCLPNEESAFVFKNILLNMNDVRTYCAKLCRHEMNKLNELLTLFLPDANAMADFKARVLTFPGGIQTYYINLDMDEYRNGNGKIFDTSDDKKHEKFLFDMLSKAAPAVRKEVITSVSGNNVCEILMKNSRPSLLNYLVQLCLPDDQMIAFKAQLLKRPVIKEWFLDRYGKSDWNAVNKLLFSYVPDANANAEYKARLLMDDSMFNVCCRKFAVGFTEGSKFIGELLSNASPETKKAVISSPSARHLMELMIEKSQIDILIYFVQLCLPNDEAVVFKKELIMTKVVKAHLLILFENGLLARLNDLLANFLPENDILEFKVKVITSNAGIAGCMRNFTYATYRTLIANIETVISDPHIAVVVKRKIFLSGYAIQKYHEGFKEGFYTEMVTNCIPYLCSDQQDVKSVKEKLLNFYQNKSMTEIFSVFDGNQFQQIILWCAGTTENVMHFKHSLPLHNIFLQMLQASVFTTYAPQLPQCRFKNPTSFLELDRFLWWYFVTSEEVRKFKIEQIYTYSKIEMVCTLMRKTDKTFLQKVMMWFFDNDPIQIQKFKIAHSRNKIANMF